MSRILRNSLGGNVTPPPPPPPSSPPDQGRNHHSMPPETAQGSVAPTVQSTTNSQKSKGFDRGPITEALARAVSDPSSTAQGTVHPTSPPATNPQQGKRTLHESMLEVVEKGIAKALTMTGGDVSEIVQFDGLPTAEREKAVNSLAHLLEDIYLHGPREVRGVTVGMMRKGNRITGYTKTNGIMDVAGGVAAGAGTSGAAAGNVTLRKGKGKARKKKAKGVTTAEGEATTEAGASEAAAVADGGVPKPHSKRRLKREKARAARTKAEAGILESAGNGNLSIKEEWALEWLDHMSR
ncbi:hypothetical protein LTR85_008789 [Meristemomyces frigidus]|nr:hypothetical protein LTR85_008789 [Meristemomyces frigidus]